MPIHFLALDSSLRKLARRVMFFWVRQVAHPVKLSLVCCQIPNQRQL